MASTSAKDALRDALASGTIGAIYGTTLITDGFTMQDLEDSFLRCRNCVRWGQPWKLNKRMVLCSERKDEKGKPYVEGHEGCRYFVPKEGDLPRDLQQLRLFVQSMSPSQISYLRFAATQAQEILNYRDKKGQYLALGDVVQFIEDSKVYTGTVDGVDPNTDNLCIFSQAHPGGTAFVKSEETYKLSKDEIRAALSADNRHFVDEDTTTKIKTILEKIAFLRARRHILTPEEKTALLQAEYDYIHINSRFRYERALRNLADT